MWLRSSYKDTLYVKFIAESHHGRSLHCVSAPGCLQYYHMLLNPLCLQGLFKIMAFAQIFQWRGAFNASMTSVSMDGWMNKSSGSSGSSQLVAYFCSFAAWLLLGWTPAILSSNSNLPVSAGLQCCCFKTFALKCLQSRDGSGGNL